MKPGLWKTIWRSSRLRCPTCGKGQVAKNWRETHDECANCGFDYRVESGFYLGAIYVNYGLIAVFVLGAGIPLVWFGYLSPFSATLVGGVVCVVACIWFWRYARSLWLGLGYYIDHNVRAGKKELRPVTERKAMELAYVETSKESLDGICYFCHNRFQFAESRLNSWIACPFCQSKILLTPILVPNRNEELSDECDARDSSCDFDIDNPDTAEKSLVQLACSTRKPNCTIPGSEHSAAAAVTKN